MTARIELPRAILDSRVIVIARRLAPDRLERVAEVLTRNRIGVIEVTMDADDAPDLIAGLGGSGLLVGAGTVRSMADAERAVAAGASFLVLPHTDASIVGWAVWRQVPVVPGALTPTEVVAAWDLGVSAVKLFPAHIPGPAGIRALRGPFPDIPLIPTGGVTGDNAADFLAAGAVAVGIGSWLTGATEPLEERAARLASLATSR
ncbi:MAG: bifunctional 4-hydroxy-2-oxoglutarate aldolase/2-dehydro-3-deoxy-phosphogluconate aldolase [Acidimicrobiia bacterium]|nr:bifunctional 4-hydroxy-2-oxoglutarate aldolase/2-dehydro-3-deoxy-phosphogluconate aldolase [Acidimicrobiia bacterium]NNF09309.1 bifunctional 4-hydroxy-2-oxoglutarate aldolase/2-dehydro-3-deoxy-phosphogluconate aldolase [Acidimicrobiia bacterium]NNL69827.1 bifunctional 4-hydroxy-2-oxoglutarate aldolase/2-dehydro-3-deoxy-phosphogluconate aldolase [Acidimicrobiia bacterium]